MIFLKVHFSKLCIYQDTLGPLLIIIPAQAIGITT